MEDRKDKRDIGDIEVENTAGNSVEKKFHYCVLYTQVLKQWSVTRALRRALPAARGTVFYPCVELWRHDLKDTEFRPLFPGYVFVRSDMELNELHEFVREHRWDVISFIKELGVSEKRIAGVFATGENSNEDYMLWDLKEDEAEFMDFILTCSKDYKPEKALNEVDNASGEGTDRKESNNVAAKASQKKKMSKLPEDGVLWMSYGYREGNRYVVMKGPLKKYEDHIANVKVHDRKAYLDIKINGHVVRAGFEVKPKRYWFPNDKDAPAVFSDGTEIDLKKLAKIMMGSLENKK